MSHCSYNTGNAQYGCEALVDNRCEVSQARIASSRSCVAPSSYSCEDACTNGAGGTLDVDLGTCICNEVTFPESFNCPDSCETVSLNVNDEWYSLLRYIAGSRLIPGALFSITFKELLVDLAFIEACAFIWDFNARYLYEVNCL